MNGIPITTMRDVWNNALHKWPEKTAAIWLERAYTYAEIDRLARNLASRLTADFALNKGDRVAILSPNSLFFYVAYWAIMRIGAVLVPINTRLRPDVMAYVIDNAEPACLIADAAQAKPLEALLTRLASMPKLITVGFERTDAVPFRSA